MTTIFSTSIHVALKDLIEAKSKRDKSKFTGYQLASALSMPRSIITKLTHPDESKRISNPKIETLIKIVEFFREDGFNVTIDDLLNLNNKTIDVQSLSPTLASQKSSIAIYSLNKREQKLGEIEITLSEPIKNALALYAENDIAPFFKSGSIFIIDSDMKPCHDTLIAIKLDASEKIHIKKYSRKNNKITLISLNPNEEDIDLMPSQTCEILGVVIQVNAKT